MKKGTSTLANVLAHLLLLMFLFTALLGATQKIADNKGFEMQKTAKDIALTVTAVSAAQQDLIMKRDVQEYMTITLNTEECIIEVRDKQNEKIPTSYPCSKTKEVQLTQEGSRVIIKT